MQSKKFQMSLLDPIFANIPGYPCAFSPDRRYRYVLWRIWSSRPPERIFMVIGLNPSTADEEQDDPTIRRCVTFSRREMCDALLMTNIFAFRATKPEEMKAAGTQAIGDDNDAWLARCASLATHIVACWGVHGEFLNRGTYVRNLIQNLQCFGKTKNGHPKHPLYLPRTAELIPYSGI